MSISACVRQTGLPANRPEVDLRPDYRILSPANWGCWASLLSQLAACLRARAGKLEALERGLACLCPADRQRVVGGNFEFSACATADRSVAGPQKELPIRQETNEEQEDTC